MNELVIANRYARALFEIVHPLGEDEVMEAELLAFSSALKASRELGKFFMNPYFHLEEKRRTLDTLYTKSGGKTQGLLVRFLETLLKKGRFYLIHDVAALYKKIADESQKQASLVIQSASPISQDAERRIASRMEGVVGGKVEIKKELDPGLIGGVVVRFRNKVLDGSVRNKINLLKKDLTKIQSN